MSRDVRQEKDLAGKPRIHISSSYITGNKVSSYSQLLEISLKKRGTPLQKHLQDLLPKTGVHRATNIYLVDLGTRVQRRPGSSLTNLNNRSLVL